jgi:hypothetical protein
MNGKAFILLALLVVGPAEARCNTNITLYLHSSLQVSNGAVAKVSYCYLRGSTTFLSTSPIGSVLRSNDVATLPRLPIVTGPSSIAIDGGVSGDFGMCTIEVSDQSQCFTPSTAVVIPADSNGPVNIILESSTDLITWTAALPGTYGTSTQKRFFRVRAERTQ